MIVTKNEQRIGLMRYFSSYSFLICIFTIASIATANAADPKKISEKRDWAAYIFTGDAGKVCYIASAPKKQKGKYKKRGQPYALVTNRPKQKINGEVNFIAGYNFKKGSSVKVKINKKTFKLFYPTGRRMVGEA
jgi:hypothetical protein